MIAWADKMHPALVEAISAAGIVIETRGQALYCSDAAAAQAIVDAWSLSDHRAAVKTEVAAESTRRRRAWLATVDQGDSPGWATKLAEALAHQVSGLDVDAPMLAAEAAARGVTTAGVRDRVLANAAAYRAVEAAFAGRSGALRDAADAAQTHADVQAVRAQIAQGWPA